MTRWVNVVELNSIYIITKEKKIQNERLYDILTQLIWHCIKGLVGAIKSRTLPSMVLLYSIYLHCAQHVS